MNDIIDSHLLIACRDKSSFLPLAGTETSELEGLCSPDILRQFLNAGELTNAVLVQRGKTYGYDNSLICSVAAADDRVRAICAVDGRHEDCGRQAQELLCQKGVVGLRLMEPEKGGGLNWLMGPSAEQVWRAAADHGALLEVHVFPWNRRQALPAVTKLLREHSNLRVVIDNLGNIPLEEGPPNYGADSLLHDLIAIDTVSLKVSAMSFARLIKAGFNLPKAMAAITTQIGAERIIWGSDVLAPNVSVQDAIAQAYLAVSELNSEDAAAVRANNARRLFDLR